ncbi:RsmE family RNA methyltransferase [Treponema brennaborense]|uniref:Ribosomal RNA small subunit methyltransferase E n=1 Tax=Treponema brennaborense (strain DSM 12168 / CIP 105900 / DD5/3) TaxID=906968 RepID=F4LMB8_TREBD|nr:RsmE family RNA methyltransferase [Treponema brennaborense]AEE17784.1 Ribosomal RNA small subunit methyltransferase E [Treponema brennaborense DSM 12168]
MNIVLFTPEEIRAPLPLSDERAKHITVVLHKTAGDTFEAGIVNGRAGTARIESIRSDGIEFSFEAQSDGKPLYPLTMIIGFPRPIQLKRLLRDVASLGAAAVHLTGTELGEKSYMKSSLVERGAAARMLQDGSIQAKSTHVPELYLHTSLGECLMALSSRNAAGKTSGAQPVRAALDNVRPECSLTDHPEIKNAGAAGLRERGVIAAVGSERGWTDNERTLLTDAGFTLCGMGTRILRTETAATAAAALILAQAEFL